MYLVPVCGDGTQSTRSTIAMRQMSHRELLWMGVGCEVLNSDWDEHKGSRSISAKSFRIREGGVVLGRKVAFLKNLHVFLDYGLWVPE